MDDCCRPSARPVAYFCGNLFVLAGNTGTRGGWRLRGLLDDQAQGAALDIGLKPGDWSGCIVCRGLGGAGAPPARRRARATALFWLVLHRSWNRRDLPHLAAIGSPEANVTTMQPRPATLAHR